MKKYLTISLLFISLLIIRKLTLSYLMFSIEVDYNYYLEIEKYSLYFIFIVIIAFYFIYRKSTNNIY